MVLTGKDSDEMLSDTTCSPMTMRFPVKRAPFPHQNPATIVGTPEHAALVEAVKRNFPEIYDTN